MSTKMPVASLPELYANLMVAPHITHQPPDEDCLALIERISVPGRINEITRGAYCYFLHVWPPRLCGGDRFCYAEAAEPLRLFWIINGHCFCRQLTRDETNRLCDASGLPREYAFDCGLPIGT